MKDGIAFLEDKEEIEFEIISSSEAKSTSG
jgi:hypothetical protein